MLISPLTALTPPCWRYVEERPKVVVRSVSPLEARQKQARKILQYRAPEQSDPRRAEEWTYPNCALQLVNSLLAYYLLLAMGKYVLPEIYFRNVRGSFGTKNDCHKCAPSTQSQLAILKKLPPPNSVNVDAKPG